MGSITTTTKTDDTTSNSKERIVVGASANNTNEVDSTLLENQNQHTTSQSDQKYKAVGLVGKRAQSVLNSLLASLLFSLVNFWDWLASRLKIENYWGQTHSQQSIFCANVNKNTNLNNKMTIQVSQVTEAVVNPHYPQQQNEENDQVLVDNHLGISLPTVLRLNSESFEYNSEEEILLEFNQQSNSNRSSNAEEVFSDYCSGSGGSQPGSPVPNQQSEDHNNDSDDHEEDHHQDFDGKLDLLHKNSTDNLDLDNRRDSGASVSSSAEGEECSADDVDVPKEVANKIVSQVETMFSDEHLTKDGFLLKHVRRRSDGFVSLKLVAGLRKVKQISREFPIVLTSLKQSDKLEVNADGTKIRRKEPLTNVLKSLPIKQAKKEKSQSEKENQGGAGTGSHSDEQPIIRGSAGNYLHPKSSPPNASDGFLRPKSNSYGGPNASVGFLRPKSNSYCQGANPGAQNPSTQNARNNPWNTRRKGSVITPRSSNGDIVIPAGIRQSTNSSAPGFLRPKSNSLCESTTTMSPWLQRRKASVASSRLSSGEIVISGVIRQPRGPDGTNGFQPGYRNMILEERLQNQTATSQST